MKKLKEIIFTLIFPVMLIAFLVSSLVFITGCEKDPPELKGIINIISANSEYSEFNRHLNKFPDLKDLLNGTSITTVFVPDDDAFDNLYATPGFPPDPDDINPDLIKAVIAYHIVAGKYDMNNLEPTGSGLGIPTYCDIPMPCTNTDVNQVIRVNDDLTLLTGSMNPGIVVQNDEEATNGMVMRADQVLIPPVIGELLNSILGTNLAAIQLGAAFSDMAKVLTIVDCSVTDQVPLQSYLAGSDKFTAFLVPNPVFEGTAAAMSISVDQLFSAFTPQQWRVILLNHIVPEEYYKSNLTNELVLSSLLDGAKLSVMEVPVTENTPEGKILSTSGGATGMGGTQQAPIMIADILSTNGVSHVVGKILIPD
ncbi:MAG TPA: fasciclin domain-containing protein [Cyclobacteriaceae bacterium]|nr:fasciclin domain-containing protein [Cyclobacteriaceae bacterium]